MMFSIMSVILFMRRELPVQGPSLRNPAPSPHRALVLVPHFVEGLGPVPFPGMFKTFSTNTI